MAADLPTPTSTIVLLRERGATRAVWSAWIQRYASRGYDVHAPRPADVEPLLHGLEQPPIVMGPPALVVDVLDRGLAVAGVALDPNGVRAALGKLVPRRAGAPLLRLRGSPTAAGWESAADRALSWATKAADR